MNSAIKNPFVSVKYYWRRILPYLLGLRDSEIRRMAGWNYGHLKRTSINELFPGIRDTDIVLMNVTNRNANTSMSVNEVAHINSILKYNRSKHILEIGTFNGNTTLNIAANIPEDGKIITVDLPPDINTNGLPSTYINIPSHQDIGIQFRANKLNSKIQQVFEDSLNMDWKKLGGPFDCIIIDGCHYYKYVKKDTKNALENLTPEGILIWHDYGMIPDVCKVVEDAQKFIKVYAIQGTRLALGIK